MKTLFRAFYKRKLKEDFDKRVLSGNLLNHYITSVTDGGMTFGFGHSGEKIRFHK